MKGINLLPWRELERQQQQQRALSVRSPCGAVLVFDFGRGLVWH
ncbi:hypothetical protein PCI56_16490 [Plesiomonas shigelloides subsp. oncorhynchi]|nr:hypothetical protein [Plesiomonas shigelloides]